MGWLVRGSAPNRQFWHNGVNEGFIDTMVIFENGDGAVVMTNGWGGRILVDEILRSIAAEYGWPDRQAKVGKLATVSPQALDRLVGTYRFTPEFSNFRSTYKRGRSPVQRGDRAGAARNLRRQRSRVLFQGRRCRAVIRHGRSERGNASDPSPGRNRLRRKAVAVVW
ncbi:hypothetical protein [Bradyrhizobium sp. 2S1]|uniref:hypothetical protein n=1 Tax=Bradyrhizobium sp. 2S1 TaxID=1404429 RepID=UPI00140C6591|nr:hypothetical protein [Bradyrhizobium sp. 2S1]MCK7668173.1 hypothetical protein [Bradyrhizobium sp. 2S1]